MRTAFVNLNLGSGLSGVSASIQGQARAARTQGLPIDFIIVNSDRDGRTDNVQYARYEQPWLPAPVMKAQLLASVPILHNYDVLFLRYPTAIDLNPLVLLRRTPARVVTVHHTKEVPELLSVARTPGLLGRAALEWLGGPRVLRRVSGLVGVTDEIRQYELQRAARDIPTCAIANGIAVDDISFTGFAPFDGRELHMLFVASSYASPWHGVDRLLTPLRTYRRQPRIVLHLVGADSGAAPNMEEHYPRAVVRHHGILRGAALDEVFRRATVAFGTLGLYRKRLRQACALKVREYAARGIPIVYAYDDVDLRPDLPFSLRLPNDGGAVSLEQVIAFAERVSQRSRGLASEMRAFAISNLDWGVKLRQFIEFAKAIS